MDKLKISLPIIVEGRYDKATLSGFVSANIITTEGFSVFNNKEKQALIRRISVNGIILMCDSDGGGRQIRSFLSGLLPRDKIHHLYIPKIDGKESRKSHASKEGFLGVEGMKRDVLERLLAPFASGDKTRKSSKMITKLDFFEDGLSGGEGASQRRAELCRLAELPCDMTANALLEAVNLLYSYEEYKHLILKIKG
jgi:ribonuclease M5